MTLSFASINSGSNGNCYYIGNQDEAVLIDAGLSCREVEKRMKRLGLSMQKVRAVFISHEHSDHINGISVLAKRYPVPVYITQKTLRNSGLSLKGYQVRYFHPHETISIGKLSVTAFPKQHDAIEPSSFVVGGDAIKVGVFTDIGIPCEYVISNFSKCNAVFLETNYDEGMLEKSSYPYHLKKRISGETGHLSNLQALQLFRNYRSSELSHLLLSHLSENNNCPDLVRKLFNEYSREISISVASRYEESPLHHIESKPEPAKPVYPARVSQLELSF